MGVELERVAACWRKDYGGIERAFVVSDGVAGEVNCGEAFGMALAVSSGASGRASESEGSGRGKLLFTDSISSAAFGRGGNSLPMLTGSPITEAMRGLDGVLVSRRLSEGATEMATS